MIEMKQPNTILRDNLIFTFENIFDREPIRGIYRIKTGDLYYIGSSYNMQSRWKHWRRVMRNEDNLKRRMAEALKQTLAVEFILVEEVPIGTHLEWREMIWNKYAWEKHWTYVLSTKDYLGGDTQIPNKYGGAYLREFHENKANKELWELKEKLGKTNPLTFSPLTPLQIVGSLQRRQLAVGI